MEYLLDEVPARGVLAKARVDYPDLEFTPSPTMNGFYASGSRDDLLALKRQVAALDRAPESATERVTVGFTFRGSDSWEVWQLFGVTFPDAIFEWEYPERFVMKGSAQDVKGALQLAASRGGLKAESAGDAGPLEFFIKGLSPDSNTSGACRNL